MPQLGAVVPWKGTDFGPPQKCHHQRPADMSTRKNTEE
jgi:hypothetical protein